MQTPVDPNRIIGRHTVVHTHDGVVAGTIVAAGAKGVSIAVDRKVRHLAPSSVLRITAA